MTEQMMPFVKDSCKKNK